MEFFALLPPVTQSLIGGLFTWLLTLCGASFVFFLKKISKGLNDLMLGFAAGVMIAASYWSLLDPAIKMSENIGLPKWFPASAGFFIGATFLRILDLILPHLHMGLSENSAEGIRTRLGKTTLLVLAITLHNIPEGLAIGVAFGAIHSGLEGVTVGSALALVLGIGIQNFPEGIAVSMPLRMEGLSKKKSFFYGQASGIVEPLAAVLGAAATFTGQAILPYALGFAAGAMIFVVVEELIPESQRGENTDVATAGVVFGFISMMILDTAFG